jgi:predicted ATPase
MLRTIAIQGYRSIHSIVLQLGRLNLVTGPNGCGKSNVYRSLKLISDIARGDLIGSLAREGGLQSVLWAGPEKLISPEPSFKRTKPVALKFGLAADDLSYTIDLGLPIPSQSAFGLDPVIKRECVWRGMRMSPSTLITNRRRGHVEFRVAKGNWQTAGEDLPEYASIVTEFADPTNAPELSLLKHTLERWRFYDHFRTDHDAPARRSEIGTRTEVLANDGHDLAAALMTILESVMAEELKESVRDAFPGSELQIDCIQGRMVVQLFQDWMLRSLNAAELSDGTLRYLLMCAALLSPRPPELFVLNEPETSLHPDVLPALARLIERCSEKTQMIVVSHSPVLIELLGVNEACHPIRLEKMKGATSIFGGNILDMPLWKWPSR